MKKMNNKGFSLVELIIVIAIMAVLVGVLAPQFIKYVESSKQSTDIQNASEIRAAIESFVAENAPTSNVTVAVSASGLTVSGGAYKDATGAAKTAADAITLVGLSATTPCKSSGWTAKTVGEYDVTTYKWTPTANPNTNAPNKDLSDAFK